MFSKRNKIESETPDSHYYPITGIAAIENCVLFGLLDDVFMADYLAARLSKSTEPPSQSVNYINRLLAHIEF